MRCRGKVTFDLYPQYLVVAKANRSTYGVNGLTGQLGRRSLVSDAKKAGLPPGLFYAANGLSEPRQEMLS